MKWTYYFDECGDINADRGVFDLKPGDPVMMYSRRHLLEGWEVYHISPAFAGTGYPGNTNPNVRRFHGWRGTTNDVYVEAHGVYTVKSVESVTKKDWTGGTGYYTKIVLNHTDIKKDEP